MIDLDEIQRKSPEWRKEWFHNSSDYEPPSLYVCQQHVAQYSRLNQWSGDQLCGHFHVMQWHQSWERSIKSVVTNTWPCLSRLPAFYILLMIQLVIVYEPSYLTMLLVQTLHPVIALCHVHHLQFEHLSHHHRLLQCTIRLPPPSNVKVGTLLLLIYVAFKIFFILHVKSTPAMKACKCRPAQGSKSGGVIVFALNIMAVGDIRFPHLPCNHLRCLSFRL